MFSLSRIWALEESGCPKVVCGSVYPFMSESDSNSVCDKSDIVCHEHVEDGVSL